MGKYHKGIRIEGAEEFLLAVNITGHGAPTEDTEAEPGMCYLDEDSEHGDLYKCIGVLVTEAGTVYRWKKLAGQEEVDSLSDAIANLQISGLTTAQINALDGMFKVAAYSKADVSAEYSAFKVAFGITDSGEEPDEPDTPTKTITGISATYSGGDVFVGTALTDLAGITVTAVYSDGSTETVTGYTLSGEISEGSNTVTVSYSGFTAEIYVTGVSGNAGDVSNETKWTNGVPYQFAAVEDEYVDNKNGNFISYKTWNRTPYLPCGGANSLRFTVITVTSSFGSGGNSVYNAFYDKDKVFVAAFGYKNLTAESAVGDYQDVIVPENAEYFVASHTGDMITTNISITPFAEAG